MGEITFFDLEQLGIRAIVQQELPQPDVPEALRWYIHSHLHYELHLMARGRRLYRTAEGIIALEPGQFCLFAPGFYHTPLQTTESFSCLHFSFGLLEQHAPARDWLAERTAVQALWLGSGDAMLPTALQLQHLPEGAFYQEMQESLWSLLLLQLFRTMEAQPTAAAAAAQDRNEVRDLIMDSFFHNYFHLPAGDAVLADQLGVSRRQLDRILKQRYGKSFREKLREMRLEVACDLLRSTDLTIGEIAERIGYGTPSNFTVFFRDAAAMTPSQYRRSHKPNR